MRLDDMSEALRTARGVIAVFVGIGLDVEGQHASHVAVFLLSGAYSDVEPWAMLAAAKFAAIGARGGHAH